MKPEREAKILLFDVEKSPDIGFTYGKWDTNVLQFIKEGQIISIAWKWLGEKEIHVLALSDFPGYKPDVIKLLDKKTALVSNFKLMREFAKAYNQADIVVAHNLKRFDKKVVNTDMMLNGLPPPTPHKDVDTLPVLRSVFRLNSNSLGDAGQRLGLGKKVKHGGFPLWVRCMAGDLKAWAEMKRYNVGDVRLLERIYLKVRPWMTNHPAIRPRGVNANPLCPLCHEKKLQHRGTSITRLGRRPRFQCQGCGHWASAILVKRRWVIK